MSEHASHGHEAPHAGGHEAKEGWSIPKIFRDIVQGVKNAVAKVVGWVKSGGKWIERKLFGDGSATAHAASTTHGAHAEPAKHADAHHDAHAPAAPAPAAADDHGGAHAPAAHADDHGHGGGHAAPAHAAAH